MAALTNPFPGRLQRGALMLEVLVTIVVLTIGLVGLLQMQARLQRTEVESYQRTQALMLLNDMANRIASNRAYADDYETASPLGVDATCGNPSSATSVKDLDHAEWCLALQGAAEVVDTTTNVGAMIGARGCVKSISPNYLVTVVWQGTTPVSAPPGTEIVCGANMYNLPDGSECAETTPNNNADKCRRYVSTLVKIADLSP